MGSGVATAAGTVGEHRWSTSTTATLDVLPPAADKTNTFLGQRYRRLGLEAKTQPRLHQEAAIHASPEEEST